MAHRPRRATGLRTTAKATIEVCGECVGGRVPMPAYVMEDEPYRPDVILWADATEGVIVGHAVVEPGASPDVFVDCLLTTIREPMAGPPRQPKTVRIADAQLASLVKARLGNETEVLAEPTPEIDEILGHMTQAMGSGDEHRSYLEGGKISTDTVARFFRSAAALYRQAPWELLSDSEVLWLNIPAMELRGACVSVIGAAGESFGFLVFDSIEAFEAMAQLGGDFPEGERPNIGTRVYSVNFDRGADIPKAMRREVAEHGWEVASTDAYPHIAWVDPDCLARPLTDRDVLLGTACAEVLARFFAERRASFGNDVRPVMTAEYVLDELPGGPNAAVTIPHPRAHWLFPETRRGKTVVGPEQEQDDVEKLRQTVPNKMRPTFDAVVTITERVCHEHLNDEYALVSRKLAASLARKRPSPLSKGKVESWACAIVYVVGFVNFLFDKSQRPHLSTRDLCSLFGVSQSNASAKATTIKKLLDIGPFEPRFCLPSRMNDNPLAWMIEVNGMVTDARMLPRTMQKRALELGLIPYLP